MEYLESFNEKGKVIDSGEFDAEGMSAEELSDAVWDNID